MEPNEPSEMIADLEEQREESAKREAKEATRDRFRSRAAVWVAILAACMAIRGLGGEDAKDEMISKNIETSDAWAHYQAKDIRQADYKIAADQLAAEVKYGGFTGERLADAQKRLKKLQDSVQHYESDPTAKGAGAGGKQQLKAEASALQEQRERYEHKNKSFDYAEMFYQLGLVLASVSILITSRRLLIASIILGALGAVLTANGFLLFLPAIFG
ncbi:MAG TPA: DUF4337 domain-containing protein [Caulobacteraceae bacterium]|jgi:hypothetical protein|nr:DUF4337 domain-containing protein [Caulobacteraceae bacterium]